MKHFLSPEHRDDTWKQPRQMLPNSLECKKEEEAEQTDLQDSVIIVDLNKLNPKFSLEAQTILLQTHYVKT